MSTEIKAIVLQTKSKYAKMYAGSGNAEDEIDIAWSNKDYQYVTLAKAVFLNAKEAREFGGNMYNKYKDKATELTIDIKTKYANDIRDGIDSASYTFDKYKTSPKKAKLIKWVVIDAVGNGLYDSIKFARDLVSEPSNVLFPEEYAERITNTLTPLGVTVKVYSQRQLEKMGFNLLLSVGQGSDRDSYVVVMEWNHGKGQPIALVGKGVCFDTGGISLKPSKGMGDMKYDMGGSAAVVGAMHSIASQKVKRNVIGIVGLVENMPDGKAIKPGDVVTSLSGMTVENLNTDAEGRLVLGDLLHYVQQEYKPHTIVDLATLTGAIMVALGSEMAGLFTNSTSLATDIVDAGQQAGEGFYRMPMGENWNKMIDSDIADFQNIGGAYGGSTTAAEFLYRFVDKEVAWAHLDIAGMAWEDKGKPITPKGAVGFGVRTLFNLVNKLSHTDHKIDKDMQY